MRVNKSDCRFFSNPDSWIAYFTAEGWTYKIQPYGEIQRSLYDPTEGTRYLIETDFEGCLVNLSPPQVISLTGFFANMEEGHG